MSQAPSNADVASIESVEHLALLDMYAAAPADVRAALGIDHQAVDGGALLICTGLDDLQFNRLTGQDVIAPARADTLDRALAAFERAGVRNWIVQVAPGAMDLQRMCDARGLVAHPRTWAKFVRDNTPAAANTGLDVREISPQEADAFGGVVGQTYGLPAAAARWVSSLVGRANWHCLMAFDGATPVAAGAIYVNGPAAWLGLGATLTSHRRQGAQSALLAARINTAARHGCEIMTTETGVPHAGEAGPSYRNIQKAGFRIAYLRPNLRRPEPA